MNESLDSLHNYSWTCVCAATQFNASDLVKLVLAFYVKPALAQTERFLTGEMVELHSIMESFTHSPKTLHVFNLGGDRSLCGCVRNNIAVSSALQIKYVEIPRVREQLKAALH